MSEHIMHDREGSYESEADPVEDPIGSLLEVFLAGRWPDGTPLTEEEARDLGSGLYDEILKARDK